MDYKMSRRTLPALVSIAILSLAGCGGGGGDDDKDSSTPTPPAATSRVSGTAATGAALANVTITLTDATGKVLSAKTQPDGAFEFDTTNATAPFVLVAADPSGQSTPLVSLLTSAPASGTSIVNVTPLTTAVAAMLTDTGDALELARNPALANVSPATLQAAVAALKSILADILAANGLPADFDPFSSAFTADHSGADAVIDALSVVQTPNGLRIASIGDTASPILLTADIARNGAGGTKLVPPPAAANYLAALATALKNCLADGAIADNEPECVKVFTPDYLFSGKEDFVSAHAEAAGGVTAIGMPRTLSFLNEGTRALVQIPYTLKNGASGTWTEFARNTGNGWRIDGNQQIYEVRMRSFLTRNQSVSKTEVDRYEAGVQFSITPGGTINGQTLRYVSLTGPGLATRLWMAPRAALGAGSLGIVSVYDTRPDSDTLTPPLDSLGNNTALYRWSWLAIDPTKTYTAPQNGVYSRRQLTDASTIPPHAAYTATFYNAEGVKLGQSEVINPALPITADTGNILTVWRTVTPETVSAFLSPTGSLAAAQPSVTVSWRDNVVNGVNLTPALATSQIQASGEGRTVNGNRSAGAMPSVTADGVYSLTITAGVPNNGGPSTCDPACTFPALGGQGSRRLVELSGLSNEISFYDDVSYFVPSTAQ